MVHRSHGTVHILVFRSQVDTSLVQQKQQQIPNAIGFFSFILNSSTNSSLFHLVVFHSSAYRSRQPYLIELLPVV